MPRPGDELGGRWRIARVVSGTAGAGVCLLDLVGVEADLRGRGVWFEGVQPGGDPAKVVEQAARLAIGCPGIPRPEALRADGLLVIWETRADGVLLETNSEAAARVRALGASEIAAFAVGASRALASLHGQGIAHGHLRGELVGYGAGLVELGGYGISALASLGLSAQITDALPARYRAPELAAGGRGGVSPASDVFALGVLVSELVAGRVAGPGALTPSAVGAEVDPRVEALLRSATSERPQSRPEDIRGWAEELSRLFEGRGATESHRLGDDRAPAPPAPRSSRPPADPVPESSAAIEDEPLERSLESNQGLAASPRGYIEPREPAPVLLSREPAHPRQDARRAHVLVAVLATGILLMLATIGLGYLWALEKSRPSSPAAVASAWSEPGHGALGSAAPSSTLPPAPASADSPAGERGSGAGTEEDAAARGPSAPSSDSAALPSPPPAAHATALVPIPASSPSFGAPLALVTVVIFGDLDSPETRRIIRELRARGRDDPQLRVVWRHRPLPSHARAKDTSCVAAALKLARGDEAFWRLLDQVAASTESSTEERLETWLVRAGESGAALGAYLTSPEAERLIEADLSQSILFGVRSAPTLFVNGRRFDEPPSGASLAGAIDEERRRAAELIATGVPGDQLYGVRVLRNLIGVGPQPSLRRCPALGEAPTRGRNDALVTIVEFGDFECARCRQAAPELAALARDPDVRVAWKNLPPARQTGAKVRMNYALEALARGGSPAFWRVHNLLFELGDPIDDQGLARVAEQVGVSAAELTTLAEKGAHAARIQRDVSEAKELGVSGTPVFFVNGRPLAGFSDARELRALVRRELAAARRLRAHGVARGDVFAVFCGS